MTGPVRLILAGCAMFVAACVPPSSAKVAGVKVPWTLDTSHSEVGFSVQHMAIAPLHGVFKTSDTKIEMPAGDPTAVSVRTVVDVSSIDTRDADRDKHLLSADFFDVKKHPEMVFQSTRTDRVSDSRFKMYGNLTIRGITKEVALDAVYAGKTRDTEGSYRHGYTLTGDIDRRDFGLTWNKVLDTGGMLIGDQVKLQIVAEIVE